MFGLIFVFSSICIIKIQIQFELNQKRNSGGHRKCLNETRRTGHIFDGSLVREKWRWLKLNPNGKLVFEFGSAIQLIRKVVENCISLHSVIPKLEILSSNFVTFVVAVQFFKINPLHYGIVDGVKSPEEKVHQPLVEKTDRGKYAMRATWLIYAVKWGR